jgi:hypothetical protein
MKVCAFPGFLFWWYCLSFGVIPRQDEGLREEIILLRVILPQFHEIPAQVVLPRQDIHAGEVVDLLVGLHSGQKLRFNHVVSPAQVEVQILDWGVVELPFHDFLADELHHGVLGV